jgi:RNA polymerase sigma factor (sigma-70 family)
LRSREEAEDAAQLVFLNAHRCLEEGVEPQSERAWLFKIAEHVVMYRRRTISRRARVEFPIDVNSLADLVVAPGRDVPPELDGLQDALARIPEAQRRAIVLREWYGLSYREVASELGLSTSAAETLIFRARRRLAQELGGSAPDERRRRPLSVTSPLAALKWVLGGGTSLKALVGVTSVAVIAAGSTRVGPFLHPATRPAATAPARMPAVRPVPAAAPRRLAVVRAAVHVVAPARPARARIVEHPAIVATPPRVVVTAEPPPAVVVEPEPEAAAEPADAPAAPTEAAVPTEAAAPSTGAPFQADDGSEAVRSEASVEPQAPAQPEAPPVADPAAGPPPVPVPVADPVTVEPVGSPPQAPGQGAGVPGPNEPASFGQTQRSEHASPNAADPGSNGQGGGPPAGNGNAVPGPALDGAPSAPDQPAAPGGGPPPQAQGEPVHGDPPPLRGQGNGNGNADRHEPPRPAASDVEAV